MCLSRAFFFCLAIQEVDGLSDQSIHHHISEGNLGLGLFKVPLQPLRLGLHDFAAQEGGELLLADLSEKLLVKLASKYELSTRQSSCLHDGHPEQVVLGDLEHLLQSEVLRWLQFSAEPAPRHWCPLFAMWPELLETVVDAVEEHLVVNVLALGQQVLVLCQRLESIFALLETTLLLVGLNEVESIWLRGTRAARVLSTLLSSFLQLEV